MEVKVMLWRKKNGNGHLNLECQVEGCDFTCHDHKVLQRHAGKVHAGLKLQCKAAGCDYVCTDYVTLERHMAWAHSAANRTANTASLSQK
jgi:hypothetical protein